MDTQAIHKLTDELTEQQVENVTGSNKFRRYVKIKGHRNWFLVLNRGEKLPFNFGIDMQEKILRSEVYTIHGGHKIDTTDWEKRVTLAATRKIDYESLAEKYGTIIIRPIGSFMLLKGEEITEERFDSNFNDTYFPVDNDLFTEVVICENDKNAEHGLINYLQSRFPNKTISTINFFDLRSEKEVNEIFKKATYITFSTTFSNFDWFKKLSNNLSENHKVIGFCHDKEKWQEALKINKNVEIIEDSIYKLYSR